MKTERCEIRIRGMICRSCTDEVSGMLLRTKGVVKATVSYRKALAAVSFDPALVSPEELEKRLAQALRKKQPAFVFHWRGGGLNRDVLQQLLAIAGRLAAERGKRASCSVNFPQAVLQLEFSDEPRQAVTIQQAD